MTKKGTSSPSTWRTRSTTLSADIMWAAKHAGADTHLPWYFRAPFLHFWSHASLPEPRGAPNMCVCVCVSACVRVQNQARSSSLRNNFCNFQMCTTMVRGELHTAFGHALLGLGLLRLHNLELLGQLDDFLSRQLVWMSSSAVWSNTPTWVNSIYSF